MCMCTLCIRCLAILIICNNTTGTNDSPALAQANVGIAMSGGTDIAVETGDMVLCKSDLFGLLIAIDISKVTLRRILLNYVWAFIYNLMLIPFAAGVFYPSFRIALDPMLAGAAMALSSVSIVSSSLLLGLYKPPKLVSDFYRLRDEPESESESDSTADSTHTCDCEPSTALLSPEYVEPGVDDIPFLSAAVDVVEKAFVRLSQSPEPGKGEGRGSEFQSIDVDLNAEPVAVSSTLNPVGCGCGGTGCKCGTSCQCNKAKIRRQSKK